MLYIYNGGYLRLCLRRQIATINATQTQNEVLAPLRFPTTNFASEIIHQSRQKQNQTGEKQLVVKLKQLNWNNLADFLESKRMSVGGNSLEHSNNWLFNIAMAAMVHLVPCFMIIYHELTCSKL